MSDEKRSFEDVMSELENIVKKLEEADIPLEEAIDYYQKGVKLSKWCDDKLAEVEKQVAHIVDENGEAKAIAFEESKDE
ncbi:exodeoxyribonuclease VII small subunit [Amphibacillus jilinensis]|uniref:exodeoxyribonuclease VII small subunit n=1 Tax=Amphibacillus jilinensis TaxID=1216008 RepID=UPI0002EB36E6|nr:exodeoxyribonuclease VII small subunit [Amphibacillus jilinensis]